MPYSKRREKEAEDAIRCGARLHATSSLSSKRESPRQSDAWEENMPMELIDDVKVPGFLWSFFGSDFVVLMIGFCSFVFVCVCVCSPQRHLRNSSESGRWCWTCFYLDVI